jgi:hypothetical protein
MMKDNTHDAFWVQEEHKGGDHGGVERGNTKDVPEVDMDVVMDEDMEEGEVGPPLVSIVERLVMYQGFCTKPHVLCAYCYSPEHVIEDCPDLLKKWEENKMHCNMVHVEPRGNKKKDEEVDV